MTLSNKVLEVLDKDTIQEMDKLCNRLRTGVEFQDDNVLWETHLIQLESFARLFTSQVTPLQNYQVFTWDTVKKVVCRTHVVVHAYDIYDAKPNPGSFLLRSSGVSLYIPVE